MVTGVLDRFLQDCLQLLSQVVSLFVKAGCAFLLFRLATENGLLDQFLSNM